MNNICFEIKRLSEGKELLEVKKMWVDIFGDSPDFVDSFYSLFPAEKVTFVAKNGENTVGMVNSLDCTLDFCEKEQNGKYIYALAVKEAYRGRTIAKKLLEAAEGETFTMLVPENEKLAEMYRHLGYTQKIKVDTRYEEPTLFFDSSARPDISLDALLKIK